MSIEAIIWVRKHAPVENATEMCILYALADRANDDGTGCWPSNETIADEARCSVRTVKRHMKELASRGLIAPGDERMVAGYRPDRRPNVWNLNLSLGRDDTGCHSGTPRGSGVSSGAQRGDSGGKHGVSSGAQRGDTGDTQTVLNPPIEPPVNHPPLTPQGEGGASAAEAGEQAQPSLLPETTTPAAPSLADEFDTWWQQVPRKKAKADARKAFKAARKKATLQQLVDGLEASMRQWQAEGRDVSKIPYPATWLRAESWLDEHDQWQAPQQQRNLWPEELYLRDMQARTPTADSGQPWLNGPELTPPWADTPTAGQPWLGADDEQKGISR